MNSLPQVVEKVNTWTQKKRASMTTAQKMKDAGFERRGQRMEECARFLNMKVCPECGKSYVSSATLCRDRLCPTCKWRLSLARYAEMCSTMAYLNEKPWAQAGFLTLTVKNVKVWNLRETLQTMAKDWNRMLAGRRFKDVCCGWARSLEITYNAKTDTFHPHYHIIILLGMEQTGAEMQRLFRTLWRKAGRLPYEPITDFRFIQQEESTPGSKITESAICETFKYAVKDDELNGLERDTFRHFVRAINGIRFISFGGIIKEARQELGLTEDESEIDEGRDPEKCDCGGTLQESILKWSFADSVYNRIVLANYDNKAMEKSGEIE